MNNKWPKSFLPLTSQQLQISDDFMKYWHEVLPKKYGIVDTFNHNYVVKNAPTSFLTTLEVGAGNGEHIKYENLNESQINNYYAFDIRDNMIQEFKKNFPKFHAFVGDCQCKLDFPNDYFDRVLAIHVLEHLPNLPLAVMELHRLSNKKNGVLSVVIPCEGSFAYSLARKISAQRIFERRYKQSYKWFIEREHINTPIEIISELRKFFDIQSTNYFPFPFKFQFCNLCIGLTLKPKLNNA